jgi:hypothetical protein
MKKSLQVICTIVCFAINTSATTNRVLFLDNIDPEPYVDIPRSDSLEPSSNITVEAWIKPIKMTTGELVYNVITKRINEHEAPYNSYILADGGLNSPSNWYANITTTNGGGSTPGTNYIGWGTWTHMAMSYDGLNLRYYLNGSHVATTSTTGPILYSDLSLRIGKAKIPQFDDGFYGFIDEVRIWNRTLTQNDIKNNMYKELQGAESGLVGYWNFNDGTAKDLSPYGNNGSLVDGAATVLEETYWSGALICGIKVSAYDITWNSDTGCTYRVQYTDDLNKTSWSNLEPEYLGTGNMMYHMDVIRDFPARFYRVIKQ